MITSQATVETSPVRLPAGATRGFTSAPEARGYLRGLVRELGLLPSSIDMPRLYAETVTEADGQLDVDPGPDFAAMVARHQTPLGQKSRNAFPGRGRTDDAPHT